MATGASPGGPVLVGKSGTDYTSQAYENAMRLANLSWHLLAVLKVLTPPQDQADHRYLIHELSKYVTLYPGDVLWMGT